MKKSDTGTEIKVGIFVLIALAALGYLSLRLGEETISAKKTYLLTAVFDDVSGLTPGATVEMAGVEIGRVAEIGLVDGKARVKMKILNSVKIKKDAVAAVRTKGMLGDRFIEIRQGKEAEVLPPGGQIAKTITPMDLDQILAEVGPVVQDIRQLTTNLNQALMTPEGKSNLQKLMANLAETAEAFKVVGQKMAKGEGTLGKLLMDDSIYRHLNSVAVNLDTIVQRVKKGEGTLGRLLVDDSLYHDLEKLIATTQEAANSLEKISSDLASGKGTLGKFLEDEELYQRLASAAERLDQITQKLARGQGTLGKLINDETLYDDIKRTVTNINRAAVGVQEVMPTTVIGTVGSAVLH